MSKTTLEAIIILSLLLLGLNFIIQSLVTPILEAIRIINFGAGAFLIILMLLVNRTIATRIKEKEK